MEDRTWDAVVIGAGAAGLSAALMLGRARRRVLVLDAGSPRNRFAAHMHGVLGNEGVPPAEFLRRGRSEAEGYGAVFREGVVEHVHENADGVTVSLTEGDAIEARALVVASGLTDELPDIPGLAERWGATVLHCPYCHGWEFRDQRLGVLTTSPMGLHQAELVRQWSEDITVFTAGAGELTAQQERRLRSRGVRLIASPVVEVLGDGDRIAGARTADGGVVSLDALYTAGTPRPHDRFLSGLGLARTETPFGEFLAVDQTGRTSAARIWAVGNVVNPAATVPMAVGAGAMAGGAVNMALVSAEFDAAEFDAAAVGGEPWPEIAPADYWDRRYADADRMWSGRVNAVLADVASGLEPGTALDLGCGEGADVIWLAEQGWTATGIDISSTAIARAEEAARAAGLPGQHARFLAADLADLPGGDRYDLVTASFLHSPVAMPRARILSAAAGLVASGGHLLITSHAGAPSWASGTHDQTRRFLAPEEEIDSLALDPEDWDTLIVETRPRPATAPDGTPGTVEDAIVLLRRR